MWRKSKSVERVCRRNFLSRFDVFLSLTLTLTLTRSLPLVQVNLLKVLCQKSFSYYDWRRQKPCFPLLLKVVWQSHAIVRGNQHLANRQQKLAKKHTKLFFVQRIRFSLHQRPFRLFAAQKYFANYFVADLFRFGNVIHRSSYVTYQGEIIKNVSKASLSSSASLGCSFQGVSFIVKPENLAEYSMWRILSTSFSFVAFLKESYEKAQFFGVIIECVFKLAWKSALASRNRRLNWMTRRRERKKNCKKNQTLVTNTK